MQQDLYYRHSGGFPMAAMPFGLLIGSLAGGILAFAYAYGTLYCPIIYVNCLLALAFGFMVGWAAARALAWLNVRNRSLMYGVSLLAVAVSFYICWAVWVVAVFAHADTALPLFPVIRNPKVVWFLAQAINESGTWSLGRGESGPVNGLFLWIIWLGEAALIFGAAMVAVKGALKVPFCEACQKWCRTRPVQGNVNPGDLVLLRESLEAGHFDHLQLLGPAPEGASAYFWFEVYDCPQCDQMHTLTVKSVTITHDKKGKETKKENTIIDRLLLDGEQMRAFAGVCESLSAPAAAAPSTTAASEDP